MYTHVRFRGGEGSISVVAAKRPKMEAAEMKQRLEKLEQTMSTARSDCQDDRAADHLSEQMRILRLECQFRRCTRNLFIKLNGPLLLIKILRWQRQQLCSASTAVSLSIDILQTLLALHDAFDLRRFLRENPSALEEILVYTHRDDTWSADRLRFYSCHLLRLAVENWEFESQKARKNLVKKATTLLVRELAPDKSLEHALPALLHLSVKPSTRQAMAGENLMRQASMLIEQGCFAALVAGNAAARPVRRYLELTLQILYNVVSVEEAGRFAFANAGTTPIIQRVIKFKVEPPSAAFERLTDRHLRLALQILDPVYAHYPTLLTGSLNEITEICRCYTIIIECDSFSEQTKEATGKILRHYLWLEANRSRFRRKNSLSFPSPAVFTSIRNNVQRLQQQQRRLL